jgi:phage gp46-like protein
MPETIFSGDRETEVLYVNGRGDFETLTDGGIRLDSSPRTKAMLALRARRGEYWYDQDYGSRFHEIKTLRDGARNAQAYAGEALQFMVDEGEIVGVDVVDVGQDPDTGALHILLAVEVSSDDVVDLIVQREIP